jgi:signal transduction histidine kinase
MPPHHGTVADSAARDWLIGGGEMGKLIRSMDWSKTPLGPIASWPQSLRTTVSLCLASNFPISIAWGPERVQIYNDGYWPICGSKHPDSMGQDFRTCWATAFPVIGEAFERALAGETSFLEDQRMFLDRHGYAEETFFTFSFSPIRDETGGVGGLFHPVTETTGKMLAERRARTLRDLAARTGKSQTTEEVYALAADTLAAFELDLPFLLFYGLDESRTTARLIAHAGLQPGTKASPAAVELRGEPGAGWPLAEVVDSGRTLRVGDLSGRFGALASGPYAEQPKAAFVLPILPPGTERPIGILIAGASSRLPEDEVYRAFFDLVAAGVTTAVANARAYDEERRRAEALADIDRAKTAFFSNVSHEFRTPLTLLLAPLEDELAEQIDPLPQARRERLATAHRNSLRLLKLVNSLLDFSRIEAGRAQACYEPTDLAAYTIELAAVFRSAIEQGGLVFDVDCPPPPEPIYVDREMWEKIVLNLLSNALKHTFEGRIGVGLHWGEDHAELRVTDTGVGISIAEQPRLFERFHRVKGARSRSHEGTGIGLALVKELTALHGASVSVESEEGRGSTFTVRLKAGREHLPTEGIGKARTETSTAARAGTFVDEARRWSPEIDRPPAPEGRSAEVGAPRSRILLADDNADMRDYVWRLLAEQYDVHAVPDGAVALAAALDEPPDLVLSDVMMPALDGFGLVRELRAHEATRRVPIILLSARAGEESAIEGLEAGADDYVAKPFSARELLARVRTHLELAKARRLWAEELARVNQELEAFSYSVSHDLRAPLRHINGFAKLLDECGGAGLDAEGRGFIEKIRSAATRMGVLIDELLAFSKTARTELSSSSVSLRKVADEAIADLSREAAGRTIEWRIGPLPEVQADPLMLRQVFANLIDNALKYTSTRSAAEIEIGSTEGDAGEVVIFVRDNGVGFDMQYADKLFGVFQRLHSAKDFEGTGIGLANVRRIIARHGGKTWASGEVDRGAVFYFSLPAAVAVPA